MTKSLFIRFVAMLVYVASSMLALKSISDIFTGEAVAEDRFFLTIILLSVSIFAGVGAWFIDRHYCKTGHKKID